MRDVDGPCVHVSVEDAYVGVERWLTTQVGVEDRETFGIFSNRVRRDDLVTY